MSRSIFFLTWKDQSMASQAYDCYIKAVVIAESEVEARALMQARTADEGLYALDPNWNQLMRSDREGFNALLDAFAQNRTESKFWVSEEFSSCEILGEATDDAPHGIVCASFSGS